MKIVFPFLRLWMSFLQKQESIFFHEVLDSRFHGNDSEDKRLYDTI